MDYYFTVGQAAYRNAVLAAEMPRQQGPFPKWG
jgi:hypothetical protein